MTTASQPLPRYIVMTSSAHVSGIARRFGRYRNVAVVETVAGWSEWPARIDERSRGVARIVRHYGARSQGKTDRCAYARTMAEATTLAASLNAAEGRA